MLIFSILAIAFFLLPYPLSWFGYIKKADYDNPTMVEYSCLSVAAFSMFVALSHLIPPFFVLLMFIFLGGMVALGAIFALPLKIPSLRDKAQDNRIFRFAALTICIALSVFSYTLLYSYSFGMSIDSEELDTDTTTSEPYHEDSQSETDPYYHDYQHEMGLRNVLMPLGIKACFTGIDEVCERADQIDDFEEQAKSNYFGSLFLALMNGLGTYAFARQFTMPDKKDNSARFIVG